MSDLIHLDRVNVRRLAADYSAAVRQALTDIELANVRGRNESETNELIDHAQDYVETNELMAEALLTQRPGASVADYAVEMIEAAKRAKATGFRLSRILVACEYSATVRDTFAARGHDVTSCDILPSDNPQGQHYQGDVRDILNDGFDMMIAHPPCTYIAACQLWRCLPKHAAKHPGRAALKAEAIEFVKDIAGAEVERACIENPKSCIGTENAAPGFEPQLVQPHHYGHDHSKETYLWRRNLPELVDDPADHIAPRMARNNNGKMVPRWANQCDGSGADRLGPSADRGHKRSKFFQGFADAMADQWGGIKLAAGTAEVLPLGQLALF